MAQKQLTIFHWNFQIFKLKFEGDFRRYRSEFDPDLFIISAKPTPPAGRRPAGGCVASEASEAVGEALLLKIAK